MPPEGNLEPGVEVNEELEAARRVLKAVEKSLGDFGGAGTLQERVAAMVLTAREVDRLNSEVKTLTGQVKEKDAEIVRLKPLADEGKQYRADLVAEALAEGVRAYGEEFDEETYRNLLEAAPLTTVKRMRNDWAKSAETRFVSGRQSGDAHEPARKERSLLAYT